MLLQEQDLRDAIDSDVEVPEPNHEVDDSNAD